MSHVRDRCFITREEFNPCLHMSHLISKAVSLLPSCLDQAPWSTACSPQSVVSCSQLSFVQLACRVVHVGKFLLDQHHLEYYSYVLFEMMLYAFLDLVYIVRLYARMIERFCNMYKIFPNMRKQTFICKSMHQVRRQWWFLGWLAKFWPYKCPKIWTPLSWK